MNKKLTISGYSTALFSTWFFIEELGLLFDAGDGVSSGLIGKAGKVKHVFISHADRDHLTGLLQFNQLNGMRQPKIYYPKDCGSFPHLAEFTEKFDPHLSKQSVWIPLQEHDKVQIHSGAVVQVLPNNHVVTPDQKTKSFSFLVQKVKRKLKPEYKDWSSDQIVRLRQEKGADFLTEEIRENILGYSGDTAMDDPKKWENTQILIHESTFIDEKHQLNSKSNHSLLEDVIEMAAQINLKALILSHFSVRYSPEKIDSTIQTLSQKYNLSTPVYRILPGEQVWDILAQTPIGKNE